MESGVVTDPANSSSGSSGSSSHAAELGVRVGQLALVLPPLPLQRFARLALRGRGRARQPPRLLRPRRAPRRQLPLKTNRRWLRPLPFLHRATLPHTPLRTPLVSTTPSFP